MRISVEGRSHRGCSHVDTAAVYPWARVLSYRKGLMSTKRHSTTGTLRLGLPLVPALEEGASEGAAEYLVHQPGGGRFLVDLDPLGVDGEGREDVAVPSGALRRRGADVARRPGVVRELKGARREP